MKKGVVVLGYSLEEPNWKQTVWGEPPNLAGRVVTGTAVLLEENCDLMIISGGGSYQGKSEACWMKKCLYERLETLKEFQIYKVFRKFTTREIKKRLYTTLRLEEKSKNATEKIINSLHILREAGVKKMTIITSPDHTPWTFRETFIQSRKYYPEVSAYIFVTASMTLYSERTPEDKEIAKMENVVIAEPPIAKTLNLARVMNVLGNPEAVAEIDKLLRKFEQ